MDPYRPPRPRQIDQIVEALKRGGVIAYPTDTVYGLGCDLFQRKAITKIYQIKNKDKKSPLSIICHDLKDIARYAIVSDQAHRLMRRLLPGPYTIILRASKLVPKTMVSKQRTIGIRIPDHAVSLAIVKALGNPLVTSSVPLPPGVTYSDPEEIDMRMGHQLSLVVDSDLIYPEPSTIIDLSDGPPRLLRRGNIDLSAHNLDGIIDATHETAADVD